MQSFKITDEIYHNNFDLIVNCGWEEFKDMVKELAKPEEYEMIKDDDKKFGFFFNPINKDGERCIVIYVQTFSFKILEIGALTHELKHLTDYIMDRCGITDKSEAPCYYLEYIQNKCLEALHDDRRIQDDKNNDSQKNRKRGRDIKTKKGRS